MTGAGESRRRHVYPFLIDDISAPIIMTRGSFDAVNAVFLSVGVVREGEGEGEESFAHARTER